LAQVKLGLLAVAGEDDFFTILFGAGVMELIVLEWGSGALGDFLFLVDLIRSIGMNGLVDFIVVIEVLHQIDLAIERPRSALANHS
jgi:hypothetical protein